jgi:hypothetical protein
VKSGMTETVEIPTLLPAVPEIVLAAEHADHQQ